jgi:acetyl esterase/lipase
VRRLLTIAWVVTAVAVLFALLGYLPPPNMFAVRLVVLADEASPFFALFTLLAIPAVLLLTRRARVLHRIAMVVLLIAVLCLQLWPAYTSSYVDASKGYSFLRALRGDPLDVELSERRIAYRAADGSPLEMRLLRSTTTAQDARPTLVVLYGGAWRAGSPDQAIDVSRHFARRGYTVAALDYRHAPRHRHPAQIDDVRSGLALLLDSASVWGIDRARVGIIGRSAGGHLALLAAYLPRPAGARAELRIRSVVAFYAPFDLAAAYRDPPKPDPIDIRTVLRDFLGGSPEEVPEQYRVASPSTYVRVDLPPTLLIYAHADHLVLPRFGRAGARSLAALGNPVKYVELGWAEHGFDLLPGGVGSQLSIDLLEQFFGQTLTPR